MKWHLRIDSRSAHRFSAIGSALLLLVSSALLYGLVGPSGVSPVRSAPLALPSNGSHSLSTQIGNGTATGEYLYVWAGDVERQAPDRLVAIDYDPQSPHYGTVVGTAEVPGPGGIDNEPHHCGLSANQKILACGGLLSVLRHQNAIFFFDVSHPASPRFLFSSSTPLSSVTDAFVPLAGGGFLVTQMGSASGGSPGRVAEFNGSLKLVHEWPNLPPLDGFNPHGVDLRPDRNLMITCDFVDPATTLNIVPGAPVFRGSVRVWNLRQRTIVRTVPIPGAPGTMDCRLIPQNPHGLAYTAGLTNGLLYLVDTQHGTARPVFDFTTVLPGAAPQLMDLSFDGTRLFIPIHGQQGDALAMLDIHNPAHPSVLDLLRLPANTGPHMAMLSDNGTRLVVEDYFLNEDGFGKVHADGDHRVFALTITPTGLHLDPRFNVNFNTLVPGLQLRPHGLEVVGGSGNSMVMGDD